MPLGRIFCVSRNTFGYRRHRGHGQSMMVERGVVGKCTSFFKPLSISLLRNGLHFSRYSEGSKNACGFILLLNVN